MREQRRDLASRWSLRARLVALASVAVALVLSGGGLVLGMAVRESLVDDLAGAAALRTRDLAALAERGALPDPVPVGEADEALVQVVAGDRVLAASANVAGLPPLDLPRPGPGETRVVEVRDLPVSDDPGGFVVAATTTTTPAGATTVWVAASLEDIGEALARTTGFGLVALPLLVVALGLVTWWLVGRALRPVEAIRAEAEEIGGTGLDRRLPEPSRRDEVGRLARTLNRMLARLQDAAHRQRRFVADAAHELRTPVASVRTRLETARRSPRDLDWAAIADDVLAETSRMEQLIEQLLVLARVDAGQLTATGTAVDLDDVVDRVATRDDGTIRLELAEVVPVQVTGDPVLLEQVVANLVDNARAHAAGRVAVALHVDDSHAVLAVDDDGPGIPTDRRAQVFERFVRLDVSRARPGGAGLGLAIVADIVAAHAGTVAVEDSPLGGARLVVRLPHGREEP